METENKRQGILYFVFEFIVESVYIGIPAFLIFPFFARGIYMSPQIEEEGKAYNVYVEYGPFYYKLKKVEQPHTSYEEIKESIQDAPSYPHLRIFTYYAGPHGTGRFYEDEDEVWVLTHLDETYRLVRAKRVF